MKRFGAVLGMALMISSGAWWLANACGPEFFVAVFNFRKHPDFPRTAFINGRLGVMQPTFARSYWIIAYRYLTGVGMSRGEREQARDYYSDRADGPSWQSTADLSGEDWFARWRAARERIPYPPAPKVSPVTRGQMLYDAATHSFYLNCAGDAFRTALHTLEERRARFGSQSEAFRAWLGAQDMVFYNCDAQTAAIPPLASASLPLLIRQDRAYQIAAAHFYAGEYDSAVAEFRAIAQDTASPWSTIAGYLVARTMLRRMPETNPPPAMTAELTAVSDRILSDKRLQPVHGMTLNLVYRAELRSRDQAFFRSLAFLLASRGQDDGLREELWDYTDLYDHIIGPYDPNNRPWYRDPNNPPPPLDKARFRDADLTDWLFTIQSHDASETTHAIAQWRATRSKPWLLAALIRANAAQAEREGLIQASKAFAPGSPGYLTAAFHRNRLRIEAGEKAAARFELEALLGSEYLKGLPSSVNLFRALRMQTAPDFRDFITFALRKPVLLTFDDDGGQLPARSDNPEFVRQMSRFHANEVKLDRDSANILNYKTPFSLLETAALDSEIPADLHRELLLTAFTRGLMLSKDLTAIAKALSSADPAFGRFAGAYLDARSDEDRRFAAAFLILHHPEARPYLASGIPRQSPSGRIDNYRDNWWCPMDLPIDLDSCANLQSRYVWDQPGGEQTRSPAPDFLSTGEIEEARRDLAVLKQSGNATEFLGRIVLSYSKNHRDDVRVPEALHLIVKSGHYGCQDTNTWLTTRAAFRELHFHYGLSEWAHKTPVWVKEWSIRDEVAQWQRLAR